MACANFANGEAISTWRCSWKAPMPPRGGAGRKKRAPSSRPGTPGAVPLGRAGPAAVLPDEAEPGARVAFSASLSLPLVLLKRGTIAGDFGIRQRAVAIASSAFDIGLQEDAPVRSHDTPIGPMIQAVIDERLL